MNPVRSDFYIPATCAPLYAFEREKGGGRERGKKGDKEGGKREGWEKERKGIERKKKREGERGRGGRAAVSRGYDIKYWHFVVPFTG